MRKRKTSNSLCHKDRIDIAPVFRNDINAIDRFLQRERMHLCIPSDVYISLQLCDDKREIVGNCRRYTEKYFIINMVRKWLQEPYIFIEILLHELRHVEQWTNNRLRKANSADALWYEGMEINTLTTPYRQLPWEVDAVAYSNKRIQEIAHKMGG